MPDIIYYSSNCKNCIKLLNEIGNKKIENTLYFSVDTRESINNQTFLILENGSRVLLPINITQVPSLLIIDEKSNKNTLKVGKEIYDYLELTNNTNIMKKKDEIDIKTYELIGKRDAIISDTFSYLSTSADDLLAEGSGGLEQIHNYSTLDALHSINTPPDNYTPNKISTDERSIDDLKNEREKDIVYRN